MAHALEIVRKYFPQVKTVKDADEDIDIEVTARDTQSALVRNHKGCAMAVACKRKMKLDGVIVSVGTAYLVKDGIATRYKLPESVGREVVSFDRNGGFRPGDYTMKAPPLGHRLGTAGGNAPAKAKPKKVTRHHMTEGVRTVLGAVRDIA